MREGRATVPSDAGWARWPGEATGLYGPRLRRKCESRPLGALREQRLTKGHSITSRARHARAGLLAAGLVIAFGGAALADDAFTTGAVNMRMGPGTGYGKIGTLPKGTGVDILGCVPSWCQVSAGGPPGWVSDNYLAGFVGPPPVYRGPPPPPPPVIVTPPPVYVEPPPPYYGPRPPYYGPGPRPPYYGPGYPPPPPGYRPPPPNWGEPGYRPPPPGYRPDWDRPGSRPPGYRPQPGWDDEPGYRPPPGNRPPPGQGGQRPPPPNAGQGGNTGGNQGGQRPPPPPPNAGQGNQGGNQAGQRPPPPPGPAPYQPPQAKPRSPDQPQMPGLNCTPGTLFCPTR